MASQACDLSPEFIFVVGAGPAQEEFAVPALDVCHQSPIFKAVIMGPWLEAQRGRMELFDINPDVFRVFVAWLSGAVPYRHPVECAEIFTAAIIYQSRRGKQPKPWPEDLDKDGFRATLAEMDNVGGFENLVGIWNVDPRRVQAKDLKQILSIYLFAQRYIVESLETDTVAAMHILLQEYCWTEFCKHSGKSIQDAPAYLYVLRELLAITFNQTPTFVENCCLHPSEMDDPMRLLLTMYMMAYEIEFVLPVKITRLRNNAEYRRLRHKIKHVVVKPEMQERIERHLAGFENDGKRSV